jgi:hypothetical protein
MDIGGALMPSSPTDGTRPPARGEHTANPTLPEGHVPNDDQVGMTWAEIVGADNLMKMRIALEAQDTDYVDAASFAGMATSSLTGPPDLTVANALDNGKEYAGTYMLIAGTVFCAGDDCMVTTDADGSTLTGSWYFTPTDAEKKYVENADSTGYEEDFLYARYGYWLADTDIDDDTEIETYATRGAGSDTNIGGLALNITDDLTDTSANYEGETVGMSIHKEFDSQGRVVDGTLQSAEFTAEVELTATFGNSPTLGGTIDGFTGAATDPDWTVTLVATGFGGGTFDDGVTDASGQNGDWTAQAYGREDERPTGIFGGFNAHFSDGHAAGAYATRKSSSD